MSRLKPGDKSKQQSYESKQQKQASKPERKSVLLCENSFSTLAELWPAKQSTSLIGNNDVTQQKGHTPAGRLTEACSLDLQRTSLIMVN